MVSKELVSLLKDLSADPKLMGRWEDDRESILMRANLTPEDLELMRDRNATGVRSLLSSLKNEVPAT
jgi:hypothetical protein